MPTPKWSGGWGNDMLSQIINGFEFKAFGFGVIAYRGDIEISVGRYAVTALWGRMPITGLFLRSGDSERHWEWPFRVCGGPTSGRKSFRAT